MIWLITFVIFLGSMVVVVLVFWILFRRRPEQQRMEPRIVTRVGLELSGPGEPHNYETTFTENVSLHGARVVTKKRWSTNDTVLVKLPQEHLSSHARIMYCQPLRRDAFAMGLQFSSSDWIGTR